MFSTRQELTRTLINAGYQTKFVMMRKVTRIDALGHLGV